MRGDAIIAVQVHKLGVGEGVAPDVAKYRRAMPAQLLNAQACRSPKGNFASFVHIERGVGAFHDSFLASEPIGIIRKSHLGWESLL